MYDKARSIAFVSVIEIHALSDNPILDIKCFSKLAELNLQPSFEPSVVNMNKIIKII